MWTYKEYPLEIDLLSKEYEFDYKIRGVA